VTHGSSFTGNAAPMLEALATFDDDLLRERRG
jgi:hypothetical protein